MPLKSFQSSLITITLPRDQVHDEVTVSGRYPSVELLLIASYYLLILFSFMC
jgi:hypothetical protein